MNLSVSASTSSTTMPEKASAGCSGMVASAVYATTASTSCVSQNETWRFASARKRSPSSTTQAPQRRRISGRIAAKSMFVIMAGTIASQLAPRDVRQQIGDRAVHHVDKGLRPHAHPEDEQCDRAQEPELPPVEIRQRGDFVVRDRPVDHALVHP